MGGERACASCKRRIANPVCEECHLTQVHEWLLTEVEELRIPQGLADELLRHAEQLVPDGSDAATDCVHCGMGVKICMPCFFAALEGIILDHRVPSRSRASFRESFNYRLYDELLVPSDDR